MRDIAPIRRKLIQYIKQGLKLFATSSFQSHSIPLLHIISETDKSIPIYYLNTGYLFSETISFKDELSKRLGLQFIALESSIPKSQQKDANGQLFLLQTLIIAVI